MSTRIVSRAIDCTAGAVQGGDHAVPWASDPHRVLGVVVGIALYIQERRRCDALAFQGSLDRDRSRPSGPTWVTRGHGAALEAGSRLLTRCSRCRRIFSTLNGPVNPEQVPPAL